MTDQEITKKIEEIYNTESGKKFISHLLRSFFPVSKSEYLWSDPKDGRELVCCITGQKLMSKDTLFKNFISSSGESFKRFTDAVLETIEENNDGSKAKELNDFRQKQFDGKVLAVTTSESNKFLSPQAAEQLFNFYATKLLSGDGHMNWIAKSMRKNDFVKSTKESGKPLTEKENSTLNKIVNKPHNVNMEDNEVLKQLQQKFSK